MTPKRCGVSERTDTMAAPGFRPRYSSAICSAEALDRTTLARSLSARRRSACWASSIPSSMTVGLGIVVSSSADKAQLARWTTVFHRGLAGRFVERPRGGLVAVAPLLAFAVVAVAVRGVAAT